MPGMLLKSHHQASYLRCHKASHIRGTSYSLDGSRKRQRLAKAVILAFVEPFPGRQICPQKRQRFMIGKAVSQDPL